MEKFAVQFDVRDEAQKHKKKKHRAYHFVYHIGRRRGISIVALNTDGDMWTLTLTLTLTPGVLLVLWFSTIAIAGMRNYGSFQLSPAGPLVVKRAVTGEQLPSCAPSCNGLNGNFHYAIGKTYEYDLQSKTAIEILGEFQNSQIAVVQKAKILITAQSTCEFSLKLSKVELTGAEVGNNWARDLEQFSLRFGFEDGKITAICPMKDDSIANVNMKRGILSTFQNSIDDGREIDVLGDCPVDMEQSKTGKMITVKKYKNLTACSDSHHLHGLRNVAYKLHSQTQNAPLIKSNQECEHKIDGGILKEAKCTEVYAVPQAFDSGNAIESRVEQSLKMTASSPPMPTDAFPPVEHRRSIVFDHKEFSKSSQQNGDVAAVKENLHFLCQETNMAQEESAGRFAELIYGLRKVDEQQLRGLAKDDCSVFVDALPMCGSAVCIGHLVGLLQKKPSMFNQYREIGLYSSLALVPRPCPGVVKKMSALLEHAPPKGLLGISSLVHSFCLNHKKCETNEDVKTIMNNIRNKFKGKCGAEKSEDKDAVILALKALGNVGYGNAETVAELNNCIEQSTKGCATVKLAAIDAMRRQPCIPERQSVIKRIYLNETCPESRITAFRQLMQCPDASILREVIDNLKYNETSNQVGSYVWSFLSEKRRSTNPGWASLTDVLRRFHLSQKFNRDPRRFSRFTELGMLDHQNNWGGHMDTSVIFTPRGYFPRQLSANLTVHFYGKSVNLVEFGTRTIGLEKAAEILFGADGYFTNPNGFEFREKNFQSKNAKINQFSEIFKKQRAKSGSGQLSGSVYFRLLGDDLFYNSFNDYDLVEQFQKVLDVEKMLQGLAQQKSMDYTKHAMLMEMTTTIPTSSGLPIRVAINATAVIRMKINGKINLVDLLRQKAQMDATLDKSASIALQVASSMTIQTGPVRQGVRHQVTLHSSTSLKTEINFKDGKFQASMQLPEDRVYIAQARSNFIKVINNREEPLKLQRTKEAPKQRKLCSGNVFNKVTGLRVCTVMNQDLPEMSTQLMVEKEDSKLETYNFIVENGGQKLLLSFDTPGSVVKRKLEANFLYKPVEKIVTFDLDTPFKKFNVLGRLDEKKPRELYDATVKLTVDGKDSYDLMGTFKTDQTGDLSKYQLDATAKSGQSDAAKLNTTVELNMKQPRVKLDFNLDKIFNKPVNLNAEFNLAATKYEGKVNYDGPTVRGKLTGLVDHKGFLDFDTNFNGEYQIDEQPKHTAALEGQQTFKVTGKDYTLKHMVKVDTTILGKLEYELKSDKKGGDIKSLLSFSKDGKKSLATVDVEKRKDNLFYTVAQVQCDRLDLNHKAIVQYQNRIPQQFFGRVDLETPKLKGIVVEASYKTDVDPKWNLDGKLQLSYPGREIAVTKKIDETERGKYKMDTLIQWDKDQKLHLDSNLIYKPQTIEFAIESTIKVPGQLQLFHIKEHFQKQNNQQSFASQARQGAEIIYEFNYQLDGVYGGAQKLTADVKSEKFNPKFNYQMTGNVEPSGNDLKMTTVVKKDGAEFGTGEVIVPKSFAVAAQKYRGDFSWTVDKKKNNILGEYSRESPGGGKRKHKIQLHSGEALKWDASLEEGDVYFLTSKVQKDGKMMADTSITLGPLRGDQFQLDTVTETDAPLPKKSMKTKFGWKYTSNELEMNSRLELDGHRYMSEGRWKKTMEGDNRHYSYSIDLQGGTAKAQLSQQLRVASPFSLQRLETNIDLSMVNYDPIKAEHNLEVTANGFTSKGSMKKGTSIVADSIEYEYLNGKRTAKYALTVNGKKVDLQLNSANREREVQADIVVETNFERIKKIKIGFECKKTSEFWNCKTENNLNDKFKLSAFEEFAAKNSTAGFAVDLPNLLSSTGQLHYDGDTNTRKYNGLASLTNNGKQFKLEATVDGDKADVKLQTPTQALRSAKMTVQKKGEDEYELKTERNQSPQMNVVALLTMKPNNRRIRVQITEIDTPFELSASSTVDGQKQIFIGRLVLNPTGDKQTYAVETTLESDAGEKFKGLQILGKYPKRQIKLDLMRPSQNQYQLHLTPFENAQPTKLEMKYEQADKIFKWDASLSDPALKKPIQLRLSVDRTGTSDDKNYKLTIETEIDYAGEKMKTLTNSLRISRSRQGPLDKFELEAKSIHEESNLHMRIWTKMDRKIESVPVFASIGVETKNRAKQLGEYAIDYESANNSTAIFKLRSPGKSSKAHFEYLNSRHFRLALSQNDESPTFLADMKVDETEIQISLRDVKADQVKLHVQAHMPDEYTATLNVWHSEDAERIDDAQIRIQLDKANLLTTRLFLRRELSREIPKETMKAVAEAKNLPKNQLLADTVLPMAEAHKKIAMDMVDQMTPMGRTWAVELRKMAQELGTGYEELFEQVIYSFQMAKEVLMATVDTIEQVVDQTIASLPTSDLRGALRQMQNSFTEIPQVIESIIAPIRQFTQFLAQQVNEGRNRLLQAINYLDKELNLSGLRAAIADFIKKLTESGPIQTVLQKTKQLASDYSMDNMANAIVGVEGNLVDYKNQALKHWITIREKLIDWAAAAGISSIIELVVEPLDDWEVNKKVEGLVQYLRGKVSTAEMTDRLWKQYLPRITKQDMNKMEVELEIPLPVRSNSLKSLAMDLHPDRLVAIKEEIREQLAAYSIGTAEQKELGYTVLDTVHRFKPLSWDLMDAIPPFPASAYVIGDRHWITFDGRVIEFQANCEFLLAADLLNLTFTIVGIYAKEAGQLKLNGLRVEYRGKEVLIKGNKVTIDGASVSLPWQQLDSLDGVVILQVTMLGDSITLRTYDGVTVVFNCRYRIAEITLAGHFHGQSYGLLGSNDNEPVNDLNLLESTNRNDLNRFGDQFAVQGQCKTNEVGAEQPKEPVEQCDRLFVDRDSPLRPCFSQIRPDHFNEICKQYNGNGCNASVTYIMACNRIGIHLVLPSECVKCSIGMNQKEEKRIDRIQGKEIVLVLEERECMRAHKTKLVELVAKLGSSTPDARFGAIGFSGEGVHYEPHLFVNAGNGDAHLTGGEMKALMERQSFQSETNIEKSPMDPMAAIHFATEHFPFTMGTAKIIVLVTCQLCKHREMDQGDLLDALLHQNIILHIVTTKPIKTSEKTIQAVGFSADALFGKDGKEMAGREKLESPGDVCAIVAQETRGTVFSMRTTAGASMSAARIAATKQVEQCEICHCHVQGFDTRPSCAPCNLVEPLSLSSQKFTGIAEFVDVEEEDETPSLF